jgi:hypothetical protein
MSRMNARGMFALRQVFHRATRQHKSPPHQITIQQSDFVRDFIFLPQRLDPIDNADKDDSRISAKLGRGRIDLMFGQ